MSQKSIILSNAFSSKVGARKSNHPVKFLLQIIMANLLPTRDLANPRSRNNGSTLNISNLDGKVRFLCSYKLCNDIFWFILVHFGSLWFIMGHFCCLALPIIKSLTCEKSQCENKIYRSLKTKPVSEYCRTFVFVSFLHASIKTWCSYLFQLSNIDTRNARKNLTIKDKELSNKN